MNNYHIFIKMFLNEKHIYKSNKNNPLLWDEESINSQIDPK